MKRLVDFDLTDKEIRKIFGSREKYERNLAWYAENPNDDGEKIKIACVLFFRGKRAESKKLLETIEDTRVREESLQWYASWGAENGEIVN